MKTTTRKTKLNIEKNPEELQKLYEQSKASIYRQTYHVQPVSGLLNNPNGFIFHKDKWHLFYQWCPWHNTKDPEYCYHISSDDLLNWKNEGISVRPSIYFDSDGILPGSAFVSNDSIYLFYTGIHNSANKSAELYTCHASIPQNGRAVKFSAPLFMPNSEYTVCQQNPSITFDEKTGKYYAILGAQTREQTGCILVYESNDLNYGWSFRGKLNVPSFENFGTMWECPSIIRLGRNDVLMFCPKGVELPEYDNSRCHNGYIIGTMNYSSLTFIPDGAFHLLDFGFESYAAHICPNPEKPDRAYLIAWMGMPGTDYPSEFNNSSSCLTLPRELSLRHRRLIQRPLSNLKKLRGEQINPSIGILPSAAEINISVYPMDFDMKLFCRADGSGGFKIHYDSDIRQITIDRSEMKNRINQNLGEVRTRILESDLTQLRIFIDYSSVEIFINDGDAVFTSRIIPDESERYFQISECTSISIWEMNSGMSDNFII